MRSPLRPSLPIRARHGILAGLIAATSAACHAGGSAMPPAPARASATAFPSDSAVRAMLVAMVPDSLAQGAVVGLVETGRAARVVSFGRSGPGGPPLDAESVFEIGSVTKVFTGTLLADMARRGEVRLDEPLAALLPDVRVPSAGDRRITLADLATHTSGLPAMPTNFPEPETAAAYAAYTLPELYAFLAGHRLARTPGTEWVYSNLLALLGPALEARAGVPYATLLRTRVLEPLGMRRTGFFAMPPFGEHGTQGSDASGDPQPPFVAPAFQASGGLKATMREMLVFAAANLGGDGGGVRSALRESRRPRWGPINADRDSMALGWATDTLGAAGLTGGTFGYGTYLYVSPREGRAVVVMTNFAGREGTLLGVHLLRPTEIPAPRVSAARLLTVVYRAGGIAALLARDSVLRATAGPADAAQAGQAPDASTLNSVGYWLLRRGALPDAIAAFRRNVEAYPNAPNPHDSLGDAYLQAGRIDDAIRSYERAVALAEAAGDSNLPNYRTSLENARRRRTP